MAAATAGRGGICEGHPATPTFEKQILSVHLSPSQTPVLASQPAVSQPAMIYGHALIAHIAKEEGDFEKSQFHLRKRLDIIPESERFERMEGLADLAHSHSTLGELERAQELLIESLTIATEIQDLSGILVARWGLADLAEISNQPDEAMVQLSDIMTVFMEAGEVVPEPVRERVSKLTAE